MRCRYISGKMFLFVFSVSYITEKKTLKRGKVSAPNDFKLIDMSLTHNLVFVCFVPFSKIYFNVF